VSCERPVEAAVGLVCQQRDSPVCSLRIVLSPAKLKRWVQVFSFSNLKYYRPINYAAALFCLAADRLLLVEYLYPRFLFVLLRIADLGASCGSRNQGISGCSSLVPFGLFELV
jgi:hypothetical protein